MASTMDPFSSNSINEERLSPVHTIATRAGGKVSNDDSSKNVASALFRLGDDLWSKILKFVPALDLLQQVASVSQNFSAILHEDYFWQSYGRMIVKERNVWKKYQSTYHWSRLQIQQMCVIATSEDNLERESLLPTADEAEKLSVENLRVCLASKTHHGDTEAIENTLSPAGIMPWTMRPAVGGWWSSEPNTSKESTESLLYTTSKPLSYIAQVKVKPLVDRFEGELQVYSWYHTKITAYLLPLSSFSSASEDAEISSICSMAAKTTHQADYDRMGDFLNDQTPVYESPKFSTQKIVPRIGRHGDSQWVVHDLPAGVVANVVLIKLYGKTARERQGYYACVDQVQVKGSLLLYDQQSLLKRVCARRLATYGIASSFSSSHSGSGSDRGPLSATTASVGSHSENDDNGMNDDHALEESIEEEADVGQGGVFIFDYGGLV